MKKNLIYLPLFISCLFFSCKGSVNHKDSFFYDFDQEGMKPDLEYIFYPFERIENISSDSIFSLTLSIRYSNILHLQRLPLNIEFASFENDSIRNIKINVPLFDDKDSYKGKGNFGLYESDYTFLHNQKFEDGFFVSVSTSEKETHGILSLGIVIDPKN